MNLKAEKLNESSPEIIKYERNKVPKAYEKQGRGNETGAEIYWLQLITAMREISKLSLASLRSKSS